MVKKEIILEGLNCAQCANKIEQKVSRISNVNSASVNFISKTLTIETGHIEKIDEILKQANEIILRLEPNVIIKEKDTEKMSQKVFKVIGLDCANCASKIEKEINKIDGIKNATMNFATNKLIIEFSEKNRMKEVTEAAIKAAKRLEDGIEIIDEDMITERGNGKNQVERDNHIEFNNNIKKLVCFGISVVLFSIALLLKVPFWIEFALFFIAYLFVGLDVLIKAIKNIIRGQVFDENFLMAVATIGAFSIKEFPEGVAVMLFYQVGEFFQDYAVNRSRKSITALMDIRPDFANIKVGSEIKRVTPEEVKVGNIIIIKPGEKIPLDGKVIEGKSRVDTSALTGESVPRELAAGDEALAGFINNSGVLTIEVTKEFGETTVSKILDLVQNASSKKAPTENFITKFAKYYTPIVVLSAVVIALLPPLIIQDATFGEWIYRALVFLVVSCPCALVVSIPLSFFGGIGGASRNGILVKGSNYLEALNNVDTVVFDKTGTLTKGTFNVTEINAEGKISKEELLELAALSESYSNHPIALSIIRAYGKELNKDAIKDYNEISGYGINAVIENKKVSVGNIRLMKKENIDVADRPVIGSVVYISVDGEYAGHIVISDEIKDDAKNAVTSLKEIGIKNITMLTGDNDSVGKAIANKLGIEKVYTELLPDQKVEKLEKIIEHKTTKDKVVFVGDGINDAPVLARADVGVAMVGLGSDAAIEAADVVLMTDEPSKIITAIKIAKRTRNIVWQNISFALGVKILVLILGTFGIATMWEAVFADVGVALIAIINAMRAMKMQK
ncbi:cadmium-translocating P-type ATPase [Ruminiclostridium herbifermentans]|uniref:Cadmium-translocating P-type ATPase n=1 Tax=Ruminiclostridium herbifermentans TaxID=2488810 RepID=A0A4U7JDV5_9FIRM|nr:heavy metal translocating P-type ATPase [Ruminiclostridium herbifermentans]QNU65750.1 cadmium-translocating P-type ATPase [Ruminiclostridium herbifermentans]